MNNMRNKILMTLALLITAVTGAWAGEEPQLLTKIYASSSFLTGSQTFDDIATVTFGGTGTVAFDNGWVQNEFEKEATVTVTAVDGYTITSIKIYSATSSNATISTSPFTAYLSKEGSSTFVMTGANGLGQYVGDALAMIEVYGYKPEPAEPAIDFKWDAATKTGTFLMPAYDVEIAPIYAPAADWAIVETMKQLPTAAEGIYAESTDSIITPGKVAMMGETENPQGEVMYFATGDKNMTAAQAMAADGWLSKLPTAAGYERDTTIYVWYYIKGANTPQGQTATAENTFNDSEICPEPIEVKILSNKFDITFKAANANTIEAGKATVTVGGTDKTSAVTEGKLEGVKMGSEVKLKAKDGYKFRKVEVKKGGPKTITIDDVVLVYEDGDTWEKIKDRNPGKVVCNTYVFIKGSVVLLNGSPVSQTDVIVPDGTYTLGLT